MWGIGEAGAGSRGEANGVPSAISICATKIKVTFDEIPVDKLLLLNNLKF